MDDLLPILFFGLVVVATHFLEGITGFGCTVLAMPFSILLVGVRTAKPILTLYAFLLAAYIVARSWRHIDWKSFGRMIVLLLLGLPIGIALYSFLPQQELLWILAIFMLAVSVRGLLISFGRLPPGGTPEKAALALVFFGGIIHGAFSSGGPLVITYAAEKIPEKTAFRATLCLVWMTLNAIILAQMAIGAQFPSECERALLISFPFFIAGAILGDLAHKHIRDTVFSRITYATLFLTAIFMFF